MIIIIPIRTSIRPWRTPYTNYALIAVNVFIFLLSYWPHTNEFTGRPEVLRSWALNFMLTPARPHLWQFVSYAFLHGGLLHIIGNMYFLYLFGNNVNDKLGHIGYLCFYLAGAVFSGIGHTVIGGGDVIGASGAVAAVTGAYLVLFPQTLITVFCLLFYFIHTFQISALYFTGFKLIFWDNMLERRIQHVAYDAHLSGYGFGILAVLGLLAAGLISSTTLDLWSMIKQWNRRRRYQDSVSSGYDPFAGRMRRPIKVKEVKKTAAQLQRDKEIKQFRDDISTRIAQRNLPAAAQVYLQLIKVDSQQVLPRQHLLDIANQLASDDKPAESAVAYEQFLSQYGNYEYIEQVELMLGILYSRYLNQPQLAVKHLQASAKRLADPGQLKMCSEELDKLQN